MRNAAGVPQGRMIYKRLDAAGPAGGYLTQIDLHPDGTKLVCGDTLQPLWCDNTDPTWKQVLTRSRKPKGFDARSNANAAAGKRDQSGSIDGCIAPSDSGLWYIVQEAIVLVVTGRGAKVAMPPQPSYKASANEGIVKLHGPHLRAHPSDKNRVMWGTQQGLIFTTDGFATGRGPTPSVPPPVDPAFGISVGFDPSNRNRAYCHSWGHGLYVSNDALSASPTFTLVAGSPVHVSRLRVDQTGKAWLCECTPAGTAPASNANIWTYAGQALRQLGDIGIGAHDVAIDPANASRIVGLNLGAACTMSLDGGASWVYHHVAYGTHIVATDVPYIGNTWGGFDLGAILFDPSARNVLFAAQGLGVVKSAFPASLPSTVTWTSQSAGIYQLIPYSAWSPVGFPPIWSSQDRPLFSGDRGLDRAPALYGPRPDAAAPSPGINHGWHVTGSRQHPAYVVANVNFLNNNKSCWSENGGAFFTPFVNMPYTDYWGGGAMAVGANKDEILCFPGQNLPPKYTMDRGATPWRTLDLPGLPPGCSAGQYAYFMRRVPIAADAVTPGTFLMYHPGINAQNGPGNPRNAGFFRITGGLANQPERVFTGFPLGDGSASATSCRLEPVPGLAGNFVFAGDSDGQGRPLIRTRNAGKSWQPVPITSCTTVSFGAALRDAAHATCWVIGVYKGTYGIHYSIDDLATWNTFDEYPLDEWSGIAYICADMNEFGLIYIGVDGKGWIYGRLTDRKRLV